MNNITDKEGFETLETIASAYKFNHWIFDTIRPFCKGEILEIGSGIGNISEFFLAQNHSITLSDLRNEYCKTLTQKFCRYPSFKSAIQIDLAQPDFENFYANHLNTYNTVFALNVIEHIQNDSEAINNCVQMLKPEGILIILVPAYPFLYNQFDTQLGHYKRYTKKTVTKLMLNNNLNILHTQYFNLMGIAGWFVSGRILKNKTIPENQMKFYNRMVPIFKLLDTLTLNSVGLSVIAIAQKK